MRIQLFTFRFSNTLGSFDTTSLDVFCSGRDLIGFREHFFVVHEVPHLLCVVTWQDAVVECAARERPRRSDKAPRQHGKDSWPPKEDAATAERQPDPARDLSEGDRLLFNELREWRRAKAQSEGVPPYILFTNRQLFEVVAKKPESANSLLQLKGVGPGKVGKYAVEVLAIVGGHPEIAAPTGTSVAQDDAQPSEDDPVEACP